MKDKIWFKYLLDPEDVEGIEIEDVFERKRTKKISPKDIWRQYPRKDVLRKGHIRVTKSGVQFVEPHLHPYPTKMGMETPSKKKIGKEVIEEGKEYPKNLKEEALNNLMKCYV